jgi:hypothetical protein
MTGTTLSACDDGAPCGNPHFGIIPSFQEIARFQAAGNWCHEPQRLFLLMTTDLESIEDVGVRTQATAAAVTAGRALITESAMWTVSPRPWRRCAGP